MWKNLDVKSKHDQRLKKIALKFSSHLYLYSFYPALEQFLINCPKKSRACFAFATFCDWLEKKTTGNLVQPMRANMLLSWPIICKTQTNGGHLSFPALLFTTLVAGYFFPRLAQVTFPAQQQYAFSLGYDWFVTRFTDVSFVSIVDFTRVVSKY